MIIETVYFAIRMLCGTSQSRTSWDKALCLNVQHVQWSKLSLWVLDCNTPRDDLLLSMPYRSVPMDWYPLTISTSPGGPFHSRLADPGSLSSLHSGPTLTSETTSQTAGSTTMRTRGPPLPCLEGPFCRKWMGEWRFKTQQTLRQNGLLW